MSVIIIGGGGNAVKAINDLTTASTNMTSEQRQEAEALLVKFIEDVKALIDKV